MNLSSSQNNSKKDIFDTVAVLILLIIYVEWFPYLLFTIVNFYDIDAITGFEIVSLAGFFLAPLQIALISTYKVIKFRNKRTGQGDHVEGLPLIHLLIRGIAVLSIIPICILLWIVTKNYFQFNGVENTIPVGLSAQEPLVGLIGSSSTTLKNALFAANFLLFYLLVPALYFQLINQRGGFPRTRSIELGLPLAGLYFALRWGSFTGTPLRMIYVFIVIATISMIFLSFCYYSADKKAYQAFNDGLNGVSHRHGRFLLILLGLFIGVQPLSMNGMLGNSWVWFGFVAGGIINYFLSKREERDTGDNSGFKVSASLLVLLVINAILLILTQLNGWLLNLQPSLIAFGGFLTLILLPRVEGVFNRRKRKNFPPKNAKDVVSWFVRAFDWGLWWVFGFALPFVAGIQDPISTWAVILLIGLYALGVFIAIGLKNLKRNKQPSSSKI